MTTNRNKDELDVPTAKELMELVGKISLGIIAVCYALGLIVVNIHLNKYGVHTLSLLQVNYILAGIWALVPIVIPITIVLMFRIRSYAKASTFWLYLASFILPVTSLVLHSISLRFHPNLSWFLVSFNGFVLGCMLLVLPDIKEMNRALRSKFIFVAMLPLLLALSNHLVVFANGVYQTIPSQIGGGSPQPAQLILEASAEVRKTLNDAGIAFETDSSAQATNKTEPILLLFVTDKECTILGKKESTAVSVSRDIVRAILYEIPKAKRTANTQPNNQAETTPR